MDIYLKAMYWGQLLACMVKPRAVEGFFYATPKQ